MTRPSVQERRAGHAYTVVPSDAIDPERRALAGAAAAYAAHQLGILQPSIVWLVPAAGADPIEVVTDADAYGCAFAEGHRIGLRADVLHGRQLIATVAHECAHLTGHHNETQADDFGWYVAARWCRVERST
jgi:hypothetical protein